MKKVSFILAMILLCTFSFTNVSAEESTEEIIEFIYEEEISEEIKAKIEHAILHGDSSVNARGILCTIFGHDLVETNTIQITHKVYSSAPRCVEKVYLVEVCEDCDYSKSTLLSSEKIHCCS